ncbi:MAG: FkbM family methyltransferase [Pseudomonadota bacterium]
MSTFKAISYVFCRFVLRRRFLTATSNDWTFRVRTEDVVGRHIYKYGRHDPAMTDFVKANFSPEDGDLLIDIGANIGWFTVLFSQLCAGKDAKVLSFEPDPENYALLAGNVAANQVGDKVIAKSLALADHEDGATLHLFGTSNRGRHSLLPIHEGETVDIATAQLDRVIASSDVLSGRRPLLIKIDIEGFELIALRGASETLARCHTVIMEYSPDFMRKGGLEPQALLDLMTDAGFDPFWLEAGEAKPVTLAELSAHDKQVDIIWRKR